VITVFSPKETHDVRGLLAHEGSAIVGYWTAVREDRDRDGQHDQSGAGDDGEA
jgi:hypothetical protein